MDNITDNYFIRDISYKDYINFKKVFLQLENTIDFTEDKFIDIINKLDQQNSKIKVGDIISSFSKDKLTSIEPIKKKLENDKNKKYEKSEKSQKKCFRLNAKKWRFQK